MKKTLLKIRNKLLSPVLHELHAQKSIIKAQNEHLLCKFSELKSEFIKNSHQNDNILDELYRAKSELTQSTQEREEKILCELNNLKAANNIINANLTNTTTNNNEIKSVPVLHYEIISKHLDFQGKHVLEIGCGTGALTKYIADISGAIFCNGIEYDLAMWSEQPHSGANWSITQGDARKLEFDDNAFDYVFSIGVFEHINNLEKALREIKRVLKPGGKCYALFEPIFTSIIGHHYNFWIQEDLYLIPPWGHLFMTPTEMHEHILSLRDREFADNAVKWIYEDSVLNRLCRKDYYNLLTNSGMTVSYLGELYCIDRAYSDNNEFLKLHKEQQDKLLSTYSYSDLTTRGFEILLTKENDLKC